MGQGPFLLYLPLPVSTSLAALDSFTNWVWNFFFSGCPQVTSLSPTHHPVRVNCWLTNAKHSAYTDVCISSVFPSSSPSAKPGKGKPEKPKLTTCLLTMDVHVMRTFDYLTNSCFWNQCSSRPPVPSCSAGLPEAVCGNPSWGLSCWRCDCFRNYRFLSIWFGSWMVRHHSELGRKAMVFWQPLFVSILESQTSINHQNTTTTKLMNLALKQRPPHSQLWMIN